MGLLLGTKRALLAGYPATRYFVDATLGSDANDGKTPDLAWETIAKVNGETFNPGESILFKRGETWREQLTAPSSGMAGSLITFGAYGSGATPIINGAAIVTGWTADGASYSAALVTEPNVVWYDGTVLTENDGATNTVGANEWDWAANELWVNVGEDPDIGIAEVGIDRHALKVSAKSYITFRDLHCQRTGDDTDWVGQVLIHLSNNIIVENCEIEEACEVGVVIRDSTYCILDGCTIHGIRDQRNEYKAIIQIVDGADFNTVRNCTLYESNNATLSYAIQIYESSDNIVEYNEIYGPFGNAVYPRPSSHRNIIHHNYIHDSEGGMGVQIREGSSDNEVYNNIIVNMVGKGCIQTDGDVANDGNKIYHNTLYQSTVDGNGIGVNNTNTNCEVKNNVFLTTSTGRGISIHANSEAGLVSDNNCFRNTGGNLISSGPDTYTLAQFADYQTDKSQDANSFTDDPIFVTPGTDFHLQVGSPCRGAGAVGTGVTEDYDGVTRGSPPDIGAYEYVA